MSAPTTKVFGASDDMIELEGQISEEFNHYSRADDDDGRLAILAFSDGTLIELDYDSDGIWRIKRLAAGSCGFEHSPGDVEKDINDVAILTGDLKWCVKSERSQYSPAFPAKKARAKR